ncbi:MAG: hypothetical protein JWP00_1402 [Chloroflexi bacterium]|jgi:hypothetical protein|nr:hypothetical protein [Chloroflexota bacterium]
MGLRCEKSPVPFLCREPVVEQCAYCGKHFCMQHGHFDKACCKSPACLSVYKRDRAIAERRRWEDERQAIGQERNNIGLCSQPECPNGMYVTCGHCEQLYCSLHLKRYNFSFVTHTRRGSTRVKGDIVLCEVCLPYLDDYKRDRYE